MSDEPAGTDPAKPADPTPQGEPAGDEPLREPGKKALDAERNRAAAAEKALTDLRKEIEDSKKTAEQKAADDLRSAQSTASAAELRAMRYEVAAAKGLDLKFANRLTGTSLEELQADADALMELIPANAEPSGPRGPHVPSEGAGADKGRGVSQLTGDDLKSMSPEQVNKARREGRLNRMLGIS